MTLRLLVALGSLSLAAGASAQGPWTYLCSDGVHAPGVYADVEDVGGGIYYTIASDAPADGCVWVFTDGTRVEAGPEEIQLALDELETVTDWFAAHGFREPSFFERDGTWAAIIYPSEGPACHDHVCVEMKDSGGVWSRRGDPGVRLFLGSDALVSNSVPALFGVMMGVQAAYPTAFPSAHACGEACWVRFGTAFGFARWWLWQTQRLRPEPKVRFGRPLVTGGELSDLPDGAHTGEFWEEIARYIGWHHETPWEPMDGFAYAADLFEALDRGAEPMAAVERVLGDEKWRIGVFNYGPNRVPSAASMAYSAFVAGTSRNRQLAELEEPMHVPVGEAVRRRVTGHPPLAVVRIPVTIGRELADAALSVRVEDATGSISYNVVPQQGFALFDQRIDPAEGRFDYGSSTGALCPDTSGPCAFDVVVANSHPEAAARTTPQSYTVVVEAHETCRLGDGVRGATYAVAGPRPDGSGRGTIARIDLDLPRSVRDRGANPIDGQVSLEAGPMPVATGFRARLACDGGGFRLTDVTFSNPMFEGLAGPLAASLRGPTLSFPPTLEVGDRLEDVVTRAAFDVGGETATTARGRLYDLRVTDRLTHDVEGLGPIDVWRIEGRSRSEMQMEDGTVAALEGAGAEFEGDLEGPVQEGMRDAGFGAIRQRRAAAEQLVGQLEGDDDQPVVILFSPAYGAVETTTGSGAQAVTSRLEALRIEAETD